VVLQDRKWRRVGAPVSCHGRSAADQGPATEVRRVLAACPTDRGRTGRRYVRLAQNAGELQCKHARDRLEVCVVERNWHNRSNRLDARRVKDCPALEAGSKAACVHNAVIAVLVCPSGNGLCECALGSAYAAKVYVGEAELVQSRPEGTPKCLEGLKPTCVEPPAAPKVKCRSAACT
jgi:hypothetical protein